MANKNVAKTDEVPETHAVYERNEEVNTTRKKGESSDGKRSDSIPKDEKSAENPKLEELAGEGRAANGIKQRNQKK